jgi:hypothetical protein
MEPNPASCAAKRGGAEECRERKDKSVGGGSVSEGARVSKCRRSTWERRDHGGGMADSCLD